MWQNLAKYIGNYLSDIWGLKKVAFVFGVSGLILLMFNLPTLGISPKMPDV